MLHHTARRAVVALSFVLAHGAALAHAADSVTIPGAPNVLPPSQLPPTTSTNQAPPPAPSPLVGQNITLVKQAGVGGQVSYARAGVMELGGSFDMTNSPVRTTLAFSPSFGWFATDNFELSAIVRGAYTIAGESELFGITGLIEPSFHLPIVDTTFIFAGLGLGAAYLDERDTAGFALAPRVGFNFLIGRSGILTPSASLVWTTSDVVAQKGNLADPGVSVVGLRHQWQANIGYSVMW